MRRACLLCLMYLSISSAASAAPLTSNAAQVHAASATSWYTVTRSPFAAFATNTAGVGPVLLGDQNVAAAQDGGQGTSEAFGYTATMTGTATTITAYLDSTSGVRVGLYTDASGKPGARMDRASVSSNVAGWVTVPLSAGAHITAGTRYWLAIAAEGYTGTVGYRDAGWSGSALDYSGSGLSNPYSINQQWSSNPASVYVGGSTTTPPPPVGPVSASPPVITGSARQGNLLTASPGTWSGTTPITYTYQWQQDGTASIANATWSNYTPSAGDIGHTLDVIVSAANAAGRASARSAATAVVVTAPPPPPPVNTGLGIVSGTATQGQTLATTAGSWTGTPTYTYQWRGCDTSGNNCATLGGATASSYTLASSDVGHTMRVVVTATNAGGSTPATSAATATVSGPTGPPPSPPVNTALPTTSGVAQQGQTLTATSGSWSGTVPITYTYQWQQGATTNISGATSSSYTAQASDVGRTLNVAVTATNGLGHALAIGAQTATVTSSGGALPGGVSLQQIDGGPGYYGQFANSFPSASTFFPIAVFNQTLGYSNGSFDPSQLSAYKAMGVNTFANLYNGYDQALLSALQGDGMYVIDAPLAPSYGGSTLAGYVWFDEADGNNDCSEVPSAAVLGQTVSCSPTSDGRTPPSAISQVNADLHAKDPTRPVYCQYTKPVAELSGLSSAQAATYVNANCNIVSYDSYVISDGWASDHSLWRQYDDVKLVRSLASPARPVWPFIEAGEPFTSNQWSGVTATPAMSVAEAWNAIIAGARGIQWFDHDFGGSSAGYADSSDALIDPNPVFAGLQSAVKAFDARVASLAPILNDSFANGYVSSSGSMNVMAKYDSASTDFYVFAAPRSSSAQSVTFTAAGGYTGPVTVQGESRTVQANNGVFTDWFANQSAVHVYIVPNG